MELTPFLKTYSFARVSRFSMPRRRGSFPYSPADRISCCSGVLQPVMTIPTALCRRVFRVNRQSSPLSDNRPATLCSRPYHGFAAGYDSHYGHYGTGYIFNGRKT